MMSEQPLERLLELLLRGQRALADAQWFAGHGKCEAAQEKAVRSVFVAWNAWDDAVVGMYSSSLRSLDGQGGFMTVANILCACGAHLVVTITPDGGFHVS